MGEVRRMELIDIIQARISAQLSAFSEIMFRDIEAGLALSPGEVMARHIAAFSAILDGAGNWMPPESFTTYGQHAEDRKKRHVPGFTCGAGKV